MNTKEDDLLKEIESLRSTNRRLNRKNQKLESCLKKKDWYNWGWERGYEAATENSKKKFEKQLANYKHATRKELRDFRALRDLDKKSPNEISSNKS